MDLTAQGFKSRLAVWRVSKDQGQNTDDDQQPYEKDDADDAAQKFEHDVAFPAFNKPWLASYQVDRQLLG